MPKSFEWNEKSKDLTRIDSTDDKAFSKEFE